MKKYPKIGKKEVKAIEKVKVKASKNKMKGKKKGDCNG